MSQSSLNFREQLALPSLEPYIFRAPVIFSVSVDHTELPFTPIGKSVAGATSISVLNTTRLKLQSVSPVTLTDFTSPAEGQQLIVFGDGQTTVTHGTNIFTNTAANKLMASNRVYTFYYDSISKKWYEH